MRSIIHAGWAVFFLFSARVLAASAGELSIRTADTALVFEAADAAPRVSTLCHPSGAVWSNRSPEQLIPFVEVNGRQVQMDWRLDASGTQIDANRVSLIYQNASPHLRLKWEWRARADFGPIEHQITIENLDDHELWLPLQDSFQFDFQADPKAVIEHLYIEKGEGSPSDVGTHLVQVASGYKWTGTSSTYAHPKPYEPREIIPWFLVQHAGQAKDGWYVGIEFSGRTRLNLERTQDSLRGSAGLNPDPAPFRTRLLPGESFESPVVFVGASHGGPDETGNVLRRWVRAVLGNPDTWNNPDYPLTVNNSWGGGMKVNEEIARNMIRDSANLGVEMFHIDAGWFRGVGDWYPNPQKFPHGLAAIADYAHQNGLKFGLWVDWTQAALDIEPGALNANDPKVRDWMVTDLPPGWKPEEFKGQTIDLGVPAAKEWAQREVERIVTDYHLDMLEHDGYLVAQGCDRSDHPHAPPDNWNKCTYHNSGSYWVESSNSTDVSYHAVRAYYDIHSRLRKDHPGLLLEVCNDGGRMVDFGSAAHADYFSITDTYDPLSNRRAFFDTSHVLPNAMLESYVEKWPTPRIENFRYMLRSGMMGWLTLMVDTNVWSEEQHNAAKEEIQLYKSKLRPFIRGADLYHISARPDGVHWDGLEYFDPKQDRGVVYAFRGSTETDVGHSFLLLGLRGEGLYKLHFQDHSAPDMTIRGRDLMEKGTMVRLQYPYSSELIFFEKARQ